MDSPSTPQGLLTVGQQQGSTQQHASSAGARQRESSAAVLRPINNLTEQLQGCTISKPKKREQTTATPASQARPRTQRRTRQENAAADAEAGAGSSSDSGSLTPSRLKCISELQDELSCGICLEICVRPCATPCGHAFCRACLRMALQHKRQCPKCREVVAPSWQPKVNVALWNTIQLLFPKHAAAAPPPTPQAPAPAAAAAAAAASSRTRAGAAQRHSQSDMLPADASGSVFAALVDRAARRDFRPPRPAAARQADGRGTRALLLVPPRPQQLAMPPDLQYMWQAMSQSTGGSNSSSQSQLHQPARQPPARTTHQRQGNPFANVARRPPLQGSGSSSQPEAFIDLAPLSVPSPYESGQLHSRPAALRGSSSLSQLAAAEAGAGERRWRRYQQEAAAAHMRAAVAADVVDLAGEAEETRDTAAAVQASLQSYSTTSNSQTLAAAAAALAAAAAATARRFRLTPQQQQTMQRVRERREQRQQQQPLQHMEAGATRSGSYSADANLSLVLDDATVLADSDVEDYSPVSPVSSASGGQGVSLFGRIHSGRSPQQHWAADEAGDIVVEGLLAGGDSTEAAGGQAGAVQTDSQAAPAESGDAAPAVRSLRGHGQQLQLLDDVDDLLQVWSDEDAGRGAASGLQLRTQRYSSATIAAAAGPRRRRGHARVIEDDFTAEPAATASRALLGTDAGNASSAAAGQHAAMPAASAVPAAAAAPLPELDVAALALSAPSPEPQPLMARLASFGAQRSRQQDSRAPSQQQQQQQQQGHSSSLQSQLVDQALGVRPTAAGRSRLNCTSATSSDGQLSSQLIDEALGVAAGAAAAPAHGSSSVSSALAARENAGSSGSEPVVAAAAAAGLSEGDDDFMPSRSSRRGLSAVLASQQRQAAASRPGSGRVVSGLRRCTRSSR